MSTYTSTPPQTWRRCWPRSASRSLDELFDRRSRRACAWPRARPARRACPSRTSTRTCATWRRATLSAEDEITLPRRRDVRPLRPRGHRHADGALGVPDAVHALPARDLPGRAAGDVRVPDGDLRADRPAGLQRLRLRGPQRRRAPPATWRSSPTASARFVVSRGVHPHAARRCARSRPATATRSSRSPLRDGVTDADAWAAAIDEDTSAVFFQQPNFLGAVEDAAALAGAAKDSPARRRRLLRPDPARHPQAARRVRRRRRRRRGPDARQPPGLRRPVVRLLRRHRGLPAPHARPHRGRDDATSTAAAASCSRCRRASSTSAARRRPRTSAPRRRSTRWPASSTSAWLGRRGLVELGELLLQRTALRARDADRARRRRGAARAAGGARVRRARCDGAGRSRSSPAARTRASTPASRWAASTTSTPTACSSRSPSSARKADIDRLADVLGAAVAAERQTAGVGA